MRIIIVKWLSALLAACLLLSGVAALAEEMIEAEPVEIVIDAVDEAVEEASAELEEIFAEEYTSEDDEFVSALVEGNSYEAMLDVEEEAEQTMAEAGGLIFNQIEDPVFQTVVRKILNLSENTVPTDDQIGMIVEVDLEKYSEIGGSIQSLKGIESFPNVTMINIKGCSALQGLNLSGCTSLASLNASNTSLKELNINGCTGLTKLNVSGCTGLTELNVSGCTSLNSLDATNDSSLIKIDASGCVGLGSLYFTAQHDYYYGWNSGLDALTELNLSGCTNLERLKCKKSNLSSLILNGCVNLYELECSNNHLSALDISQCVNLEQIDVSGNEGLSELNISGCTKILSFVSKQYRSVEKGIVTYLRWSVYWSGQYVIPYTELTLDEKTQIITPGVKAQTWLPFIDATKKSGKKSVTAKPYSVYQLNLGDAKGAKFKSSKKKVATVDSAGLITIWSGGKTDITFKVGKNTRKVTLTVKDPTVPNEVMLDLIGYHTKHVGETLELEATIPEGTVSGIKWTTNRKKIATVDSSGVVTFKKPGKVTITATAVRGKKKAVVRFKVIK